MPAKRILLRLCLFLFIVSAGVLVFEGCAGNGRDEATSERTVEEATGPSDQPIADFQKQLLDLAFETASAFPLNPHIKNRSRAQEQVVKTCLEMDQPERAARYVEEIDNWRRGMGYADLAFYCARNGHPEAAERYLSLAEKVFETTEDWRKSNISARIAQTYTWLGQPQKADRFEAGLEEADRGKVDRVKAMLSDDASFDKRMSELEELVSTGNFDPTLNALRAYAELFDSFYEDESRRLLIEERIRTSWDKTPIVFRLETLNQLAEFALDHADQSKALDLVKEAKAMMDSFRWDLEYRIPVAAQIAELRYRAGDTEQALTDAADALEYFEQNKDKLMNIWRAETIRPLAETYVAMGDQEAALDVYRIAVEEGALNPNARPRAEDLAETCTSMALNAVQPDEQLWLRLRELHEGLGDPW